MLVDQQDANVFSLGRKGIESRFDSRVVGLAVHDQEILLRVGRGCNML